MHGIFDVNNDGVISFDDFIILADKFGDLGHLDAKEMEEFREVMKVISFSKMINKGILGVGDGCSRRMLGSRMFFLVIS
jgi:hypothetical protein